MPLASVMIPDGPAYHAEAFAAGLRKHGYQIQKKPRGEPGDVLVIWNRTAVSEPHIRHYKANSCPVIVVENGWIAKGGERGRVYAICLDHHNGAGDWYVGDNDRWKQFGITLKPWRETGDFLLLLPQRGYGEPGVAMPRGWVDTVTKRLKSRTKLPVHLRAHPGMNRDGLEAALEGAYAVVTWASGAGIKAIALGVPVFYGLSTWIGGPAGKFGLEIEKPFLGDRMPMFHRLSWAQWTLSEVESGEPFACLLK